MVYRKLVPEEEITRWRSFWRFFPLHFFNQTQHEVSLPQSFHFASTWSTHFFLPFFTVASCFFHLSYSKLQNTVVVVVQPSLFHSPVFPQHHPTFVPLNPGTSRFLFAQRYFYMPDASWYREHRELNLEVPASFKKRSCDGVIQQTQQGWRFFWRRKRWSNMVMSQMRPRKWSMMWQFRAKLGRRAEPDWQVVFVWQAKFQLV